MRDGHTVTVRSHYSDHAGTSKGSPAAPILDLGTHDLSQARVEAGSQTRASRDQLRNPYKLLICIFDRVRGIGECMRGRGNTKDKGK